MLFQLRSRTAMAFLYFITLLLSFFVCLLSGAHLPNSTQQTPPQPNIITRRIPTLEDFQPHVNGKSNFPPHINGKTNNKEKPELPSIEHLEGNFTNGETVAVETQQSTCSINTEQLVASAQASVTRELKGLCTSQRIEEYMKQMMDEMGRRMDFLVVSIESLEKQVEDLTSSATLLQKTCAPNQQEQQTIVYQNQCECEAQPHPLSRFEQKKKSNETEKKTFISEVYENGEFPIIDSIIGRESEIKKYNSTIHVDSESSKKVFIYYWRLEEIKEKLKWSTKRSIRSESFYIYPGGYRLYLLSFPRHDEDRFFIQVGITTGDFDRSLEWPFNLKFKLTILNQIEKGSNAEDISSRVWNPLQLCSEFNWQRPAKGDNNECVGLQIPHHTLYKPNYIFDDSIVVKLTVFLHF